MATVLELSGLSVRYQNGGSAVHDASFTIGDGECVAVIGPNGAGKSSMVRAIAGALPYDGVSYAGSILHRGREITGLRPWTIAKSGICFIPERMKVFPTLTVGQNLSMFAERRRSRTGRKVALEYALALFPGLMPRMSLMAGLLSGGEQQMLAIAGALSAEPDLLVVDEPTLGLAPIVIQQVIRALAQIRHDRDLTLLLVDQNVSILKLADRVYAMATGQLSLRVHEDGLGNPFMHGFYHE